VSPLATAAAEYLSMRRALGFRLYHHTWWLPDFVAFVHSHGSSTITAELAVHWARQPAHGHPNWWAAKLAAIRQFARYYRAYDPRTEVPSPDLLPRQKVRHSPYIYTEDEIRTLLEHMRHLPRPVQRETYSTLLGLLVVTGMRVGEVLALDDPDVDWHRSRLTVRRGKFGKSRLLPLHPSTMAALHRYARARERLFPDRSTPSLFVSSTGRRVILQNLQHVFLRLVRLCRIGQYHPRTPRLHDIRHSFAVKTVRDWYRSGVDVEPRMAALSAYLGHVCPSSTYWYLTATPDLLALACGRLEQASTVQP
jgi:integrase/recombinase XerD